MLAYLQDCRLRIIHITNSKGEEFLLLCVLNVVIANSVNHVCVRTINNDGVVGARILILYYVPT